MAGLLAGPEANTARARYDWRLRALPRERRKLISVPSKPAPDWRVLLCVEKNSTE
jgi:hypothetical protein